jgi:hypothetical protein
MATPAPDFAPLHPGYACWDCPPRQVSALDQELVHPVAAGATKTRDDRRACCRHFLILIRDLAGARHGRGEPTFDLTTWVERIIEVSHVQIGRVGRSFVSRGVRHCGQGQCEGHRDRPCILRHPRPLSCVHAASAPENSGSPHAAAVTRNYSIGCDRPMSSGLFLAFSHPGKFR